MRKTLSLSSAGSRHLDDEPDPEDLDPALNDALAAAGVTIGAPMGRDREGHLAPRRGLDSHDRDVVVHLVELPEGTSGARTLRRLADLRSLRHPAIAPVREVIALPGHWAAVTVELVAGADLAVVLGARGALTRAETTRVLEDLGGALAHLHEHGLTHGDVSPANVVVSAGGGPVLVDLLGGVLETGTQGCAAPERSGGGAATAASDVYALAALLSACASGSTVLRRRLESVLADALDPDPSLRPTAREMAARAPELGVSGEIELPDGARLAAGALRAAAARPTRLVGSRGRAGRGWGASARRRRGAWAGGATTSGRPGSGGETGRPRSHRAGRRLVVLALVAVAAVVAGALFAPGSPLALREAAQVGSATPTAGESGESQDESPDMVAIVVGLSAARDDALNSADADALAATTVPGSPAALADQGVLDSLTAAGERVEGLDTSLSGVVEVEVPEASAVAWPGARAVRVTQSQPPSTRVSADGSVRTVPALEPRDVVLILVPGPWRVAEVLAP